MNSVNFAKRLTLSNAGIAVLPVAIVLSEIQSGELIPLLTDYKVESPGIYLVYPERRQMAPKLRVFLDFVVSWAQNKHGWAEFYKTL